MKIISLFGTRPEAIKMIPIIKKLNEDSFFKHIVVSSGQHKDLLNDVLDLYKITPDYNMEIMTANQSLNSIISKILNAFNEILDKENPDLVLIHGDTTTAMAGALACFNNHIKIGHIEAGLRSFNLQSPFPEEMNRVFIDTICDYYFAPTMVAESNLIKQGVNKKNVYVVGNTIIDLVKYNISLPSQINYREFIGDKKLILLTTHRRENLGKNMQKIFQAVNMIIDKHKDVCVIFPMHPNPKIKEIAIKLLKKDSRILITKPLNPIQFNQLESIADIVMTDSGGIQEECVYFGKPVLVLRDSTERVEKTESNNLILVGTDVNKINEIFDKLASNNFEGLKNFRSSNVYGDGNSSSRILEIIRNLALTT